MMKNSLHMYIFNTALILNIFFIKNSFSTDQKKKTSVLYEKLKNHFRIKLKIDSLLAKILSSPKTQRELNDFRDELINIQIRQIFNRPKYIKSRLKKTRNDSNDDNEAFLL